MLTSQDRRISGFTLIEVMVAAAILAIVIGAIYGAFRAGSQSSVLMEESADLNQTARVLLGRMNTELCSIYQPSGSTTSSLTGGNDEASGSAPYFDKLTFTTASHEACSTVIVRSDVCTVTYSAESTPDGTPLGLFIREDFTPGLHGAEESDEDLPVTRISDLVVGMDCSYMDPDTEEWVDEWLDRPALPAAVRVELVLQSKRKGAQPITVAMTTNLPARAPSPSAQGED